MKRAKKLERVQVIDIEDRASCRFWLRELGVNIDDLRRAVQEVGADATEVRHYLAVKHHRQVQREMS